MEDGAARERLTGAEGLTPSLATRSLWPPLSGLYRADGGSWPLFSCPAPQASSSSAPEASASCQCSTCHC